VKPVDEDVRREGGLVFFGVTLDVLHALECIRTLEPVKREM
jgi:hypothetical protein